MKLALAVFACWTLSAADTPTIHALSTDPDHVTGGDVLVEITAKSPVKITLGERDLTADFRRTDDMHWLGLVTGLAVGRNTLKVDSASLEITNYPITGPVLSGPQIQPFLCQTAAFKLPDGAPLGPPLDASCSAPTVIQYVYWPTGEKPKFKPLTNLIDLPADVAMTTISTGATVRFIVRVETGTMNRAIYQNAILHDPTVDPPPTPFAPPPGWNKRLIAVHASGCPGGWYVQGSAMGVNPLDKDRLAEGFALFTSTLNHPSNSCNALVAGETTMMGKEHFVETFGVPIYTLSTGGSGGAYTSLQVADAFPGLFDGLLISATFPDALSIALSGLDGHLLAHYFTETNPDGLTDAQKVAISGYAGMEAFLDAANQAQRTDPTPGRKDIAGYLSARWKAEVPEGLRYDPVANPKGARPTVFDVARSVYGVDPATGFALRPFDNVGVQYGLHALNAGTITPAQFLDLNARIGGVDRDGNYTPARTVGDSGAIRRAHQGGLILSGKGGLASIPIFDNATSTETRAYHYGWFHFAVRERLRQANGDASNMVMWRSMPSAAAGRDLIDRWMTAYKSDLSIDSQRAKVLRAKPVDARDGCYDKSTPPHFLAEDLVFTSKPTSECSTLYPVYSNPRYEAGGPLAANVLKCQLKPLSAADYAVPFTPEEFERLQTIFPAGVCDFAKPGVGQTSVVPWPSFGPSPVNRIDSAPAQ
jgi:hypothetical protein